MQLLFALTLFLNSALLFLIEPLFARMVLPSLGGTPAVWNTCMVFYQAMLLAGYAYAHLTTSRHGTRAQVMLHLALLPLPLLVLPIGMAAGWTPPRTGSPIFWLLGLLGVSIGLPFFVVSASGPLLQRWFAGTRYPGSSDPYYLYSASNLGSMAALLGYPLLLEPNGTLRKQGLVWTAGYLLLVLLIGGCAWIATRSAASPRMSSTGDLADPRDSGVAADISPGRRALWVLLAFVPSSLMLSVTNYLSTDIAAIPLLWVIPLGIYLLSFILVFARWDWLSLPWLGRAAPLVVLVLMLAMLSEATEPVWLLLGIHLLGLFVISMACHGTLARDRPRVEYLTEYYFWLSVGGVLGGLFNALLAPLVFNNLSEYPLVLIVLCILSGRIRRSKDIALQQRFDKHSSQAKFLDFLLPLALGLLTLGAIRLSRTLHLPYLIQLGFEPSQIRFALAFAAPAVLAYTFLDRPLRFALGVSALILASLTFAGPHGKPIYRERSFFGVHRVTLDPAGRIKQLVHGNTVHGRQSTDPAREGEPLAYYHRSGPIGQVFKALSGRPLLDHVGIVGLGAGSLAAYAKPGQQFDYYEIDPTVVRIAQAPEYFTFWKNCRAEKRIILGDARLTLEETMDHAYGLLVLDAFSSDSIPLHLLSREALKLYRRKITSGGVLAFHISNRYLDLEPVLAELAADAGLVCLTCDDLDVDSAEQAEGKSPSIWLVMTAHRGNLGSLSNNFRWHPSTRRPGRALWTDDYSNLLGVLKWE